MNRIIINLKTGEQTSVPYTEAELDEYNAKKAEQDALDAAQVQLKAAFDTATAEFEKLARWKRSYWKNLREDIGEAILAGDIDAAREILTEMPTTFYPDCEADRDIFLALLPAE